YDNGVVHVLDASRSVTVVSSLLNKDQEKDFLQNISTEYKKLREDFAKKKTTKAYLGFADAQKNRVAIDWNGYTPQKPSFTVVKVFEDYDLAEIRKYLDWQPFFIAWEMHGKFPQILSDEVVGKEATKRYNDATRMVDQIISEKWLHPRGVAGFWNARATAPDTVEVKNTAEGGGQTLKLEFLRQQVKKAAGQPNLSLADFIKPSAVAEDYIGAFSVTMHGIEPHLERFIAAHDDYSKIMMQALTDRFAEAFAELLHEKVRKEFWGYQKEEQLSNEQLIREEYVGIRPAQGYPACPDHTEKYILFQLLGGEKNTGINL